MLVDIESYPPAVAQAGNEILFKLKSNNRFSTPGTSASLVFTFANLDTTVGHTFSISWGTISLTFTLVASPDASGTQIHVGSLTLDEWIAVFALELMRNYYLWLDFDCATDLDANTITLTAKETGSAYDMTIDYNLDNVTIEPTAGTDEVARENYELLCLVELWNGSAFEFMNEDRITPDNDGYAEFDLSDLFIPQLAAEFYWPEENDVNSALRENHIRKYQLHYAELYDEIVGALDPYASLNPAYAMLGAFDYKMIAALNGVEYALLDFITTYKAFLTWQPTTKTINQTQPEKLYFLVFNDISTLELHIKIYFTDGTNREGPIEAITPVSQYQVYEFMAGYGTIDWGKQNPDGKTIERYEIWLEDDSNPGVVQSQVRTFVMETKTYRHERIFLFRNSFGGFDTFRATGRKKQNNEYERMIVERNDEGFSLQEQYQVLERSVFSVNSGWLTFAQRNWLRDLLLSKEAYEIIGGYKFPIIINDEKRDFMDDDDYLYSLEINYKYAFKDPVFTGDFTSMPLLAENLEILLNEDGAPLYG